MLRISPDLTAKAIDQVLELSADAHVARRCTPKDSPEFHNLTGKIKAYAKVLALLTALQKREEFFSVVNDHKLPLQLAEAPALLNGCF